VAKYNQLLRLEEDLAEAARFDARDLYVGAQPAPRRRR
jgi:enolase